MDCRSLQMRLIKANIPTWALIMSTRVEGHHRTGQCIEVCTPYDYRKLQKYDLHLLISQNLSFI